MIADAEVHDLDSAAVGETFRVFVAHCHAPATRDVPVVYLTDANAAFGMAVDIVRYLQLSRHLPQLLVVGIGYPVEGFRAAQAVRTRDLTPTVREDGMAGSDGVPHPSGGAAPFLSFVADELQPWVRARFPVGPGATYVGHSFGGLFGAYTLLERPATFDRYVLGSPSIWWDDKTMLQRALAAPPMLAAPADVAILVGGEETPDGRRRADEAVGIAAPSASTYDLAGDARLFADALVGWRDPALTVRFRCLPDEHHVTVPSMSISLGLRAVLGAPGADRVVPRYPAGGTAPSAPSVADDVARSTS